jgi:carboxylesterase type B
MLRLLLPLSLLLSRAAAAGQSWPTVALASGTVRGAVEQRKGVTQYLGVPFAAPPIDGLRFRPPQPPSAWSGTLDATNWPSPCVQYSGTVLGHFLGNEDCLYANVIVPGEILPEEPLAVLVWIYGGGFIVGPHLSYILGLFHKKKVRSCP